MESKLVDQEKVFEDLFDNGYTSIDIELIPKKLVVTIRNLSSEDYLAVDSEMLGVKGNESYLMQLYSLKKLSCVLIKYKNKDINSREDARKILDKLPVVFLEKLLKLQIVFEKEIKACTDIEEIEKTFFAQPVSQEKQEQLPKE